MSLIVKDIHSLYNQPEGWIMVSVKVESSSTPTKFESSKDGGITWEVYDAILRGDTWDGWAIYLNQNTCRCKIRVANNGGDVGESNVFIVSKQGKQNPSLSLESGDFWDLETPLVRGYAVTHPNNLKMTIKEKLNGEIIRTLTDQISGQNINLDLASEWDNINYGLNSIEVSVEDSDGMSVSAIQRFSKLKKVTIEISEHESLKRLQKHIVSIGEDVRYIELDLKGILQTKNIQITQDDTLITLIKKVRDLPSMKILMEIEKQELILRNNIKEVDNLKNTQSTQDNEILSNMLATTEVFEMLLSMAIPNTYNKNIGGNSMVEVYVTLILKGAKTIEQVPAIIRAQVKEQLDLLTK